MNTEAMERRRISRRVDDCRPDGGAFVVTICIFSLLSCALGFVGGTWFGWFLK
jgi:hypothetical protein